MLRDYSLDKDSVHLSRMMNLKIELQRVIPLFHTGPESHELPRIDKYLVSCLNRTQFVKILTDSHSP